MSAGASDMITIPRADFEALKAEVRRLRREAGRRLAQTRIDTDPGPGDAAPTFSRSQIAEAWGVGD
jgi:hypothetical protein